MTATTQLVARKARIRMTDLGRGFTTNGFNLLTDIQRDYGDLVQIQVLPWLSEWMIFSPELAHDILVEHPEQYKKADLGRQMLRDSFGNGIFFSEGDFWKRQRKLAQPAFHHTRINIYAKNMVEQTKNFTANWQDGAVIDLDKAMHALTLTIVVNALFKTDISEETGQIGAAMQLLGSALGEQTASVVQAFMPPWVPTPVNLRKKSAVNSLNTIIYRLIAEHRARPEDRGDLLSMFLAAKDEETGEQMTDLQIHDELMTMFIAGHETSAIALTWALIELARRPEITARLTADLDRVLAGRMPILEDLPQLPLLSQVVKETLRLYPPAIFAIRQSLRPMTLGGKTVKKADLIALMIVQIHRDPRWYDDPLTFRPDRFAGDLEKTLPKSAYMPFGAGPRVCIGNGFAMLEMQIVLATLLQRFNFELIAQDIRPKFGLTLSFASPVQVRVRERKNSG
jgi:cytochrome P450